MSAGATMIALAASANGANIRVECVTETGVVPITEPLLPATSDPKPVPTVRLWLKQPPTLIMKDLGIESGTSQGYDTAESSSPCLAVYGGDCEISAFVAAQCGCNLEGEEVLGLWQSSIREGASVSLECSRYGEGIYFRYSPEYTQCEIPFSLEPAAKRFWALPRADGRTRLARKAALVFHQFFKASDYETMDDTLTRPAISLVLVGMFVGHLKSLTSGWCNENMAYAWTADIPSTIRLVSLFATTNEHGVSYAAILHQIARIWGGLIPGISDDTRFHSPISRAVTQSSSAVGIVCPRLVILSSILVDPTLVAEKGIATDLFSFYEGSTPMLPADLETGLILAVGNPGLKAPLSMDFGREDALVDFTSSGSSRSTSELNSPIFSVEPATNSLGAMGLSLCVWASGDLLMILDPWAVLRTLLASRALNSAMWMENKKIRSHLGSFSATLGVSALKRMHNGLSVRGGTCIIDVGANMGWLVVASGILLGQTTVCAMSEADRQIVANPKMLFEDDSVIILVNSEASPNEATLSRREDDIKGLWCWYDTNRRSCRFGGVDTPLARN